jgi:hypothetical protein
MMASFIEILNGTAFHTPRIPHLAFDDFRKQAIDIISSGGKVVQYFAYTDGDSEKIMAVLRTDKLLAATCNAPASYPALTAHCEQFHLFEREIAEQYGIRPEGHPWLKMVRYHPNCRG